MKRSLFRRPGATEAPRTIGHPALGRGESFQHGTIRYISVDEAIYRHTRGEEESVAKLARLRRSSSTGEPQP